MQLIAWFPLQIAIQTAINIIQAKTIPEKIYAAVEGGVQAAVVVAQPIPYKRGTKSAKGGLSLVGEEGAELTMLPQGTKVLPAKQTKTHSEAIDAMFDNRFDAFVLDRYVNPALVKAKREKVQREEVSFAENITRSMTVNQMGLSESQLEKIRRRGQNINNVEDFARAIAQAVKSDPYRR